MDVYHTICRKIHVKERDEGIKADQDEMWKLMKFADKAEAYMATCRGFPSYDININDKNEVELIVFTPFYAQGDNKDILDFLEMCDRFTLFIVEKTCAGDVLPIPATRFVYKGKVFGDN